jgi:hypothetical protein
MHWRETIVVGGLAAIWLLPSPEPVLAAKTSASKLGEEAEISLSVKDLDKSAKFYRSLGFRDLPTAAGRAPVRLDDGVITLGLYAEKFASPRLTYYTASVASRLKALAGVGAKQSRRSLELKTPEGLSILIRPLGSGKAPARPLIEERKAIGKCGTFGELAIDAASFR